MFYTYMLECTTNRMPTFYTGYTNDLNRRFSEHSSGRGARYTKGKELHLVFYQSFPTQKEAMNRELEIKGMPRKKKEALVKDVFLNELVVKEY
jgi:putative endonuclease